MLVSIRKSQTDQLRDGGTVVLAEFKDAGVCPVKLMRRYLELARVPPPPGTNDLLFRPISDKEKRQAFSIS